MHEARLFLRPTLLAAQGEDFLEDPTPERLAERYSEHPEQRTLDLYAILTPAIDEITTMMTATPPPHVYSFTDLESHAENRLNAAISTWQQHPWVNKPAYDALSLLHNNGVTKWDLLRRGSKTASLFMNGMLAKLPGAYQKKYGKAAEVSSETLLGLAEKNYPFVVKNAKQHIADLDTLASFGRSKYANGFTTAFSYLELDEEDQLRFSDAFLKHVSPEFQTDRVLNASGGKIGPIGCPAIHSPAIRRLWKWHLIGAERIYKEEYSQRVPTSGLIYKQV